MNAALLSDSSLPGDGKQSSVTAHASFAIPSIGVSTSVPSITGSSIPIVGQNVGTAIPKPLPIPTSGVQVKSLVVPQSLGTSVGGIPSIGIPRTGGITPAVAGGITPAVAGSIAPTFMGVGVQFSSISQMNTGLPAATSQVRAFPPPVSKTFQPHTSVQMAPTMSQMAHPTSIQMPHPSSLPQVWAGTNASGQDDDDDDVYPDDEDDEQIVPVTTQMSGMSMMAPPQFGGFAGVGMAFQSQTASLMGNISKNSSVGMLFNDGYLIRQLFEFMRLVTNVVPIVFDERGISIDHPNSRGTANISVHLPAEDITEYEFNPALCNDPTRRRTAVSVKLEVLVNNIKSITRRQGFRMFHISDYPDYLFILPTNRGSSMIPIPLVPYQEAIVNMDPATASLTKPNYTMSLSEFSTACNVVSRHPTSNYGLLCSYPKGIRLTPADDSNNPSRNEIWGNTDSVGIRMKAPTIKADGTPSYPEYEYYNIIPLVTYVDKLLLKALSKMNGLHANGNIRIYSAVDQLTRLEVKIGPIGMLKLTLQGKTPEEYSTYEVRRGRKAKML